VKKWRFSHNQCYDQIVSKTICSFRKKRTLFWKKYFKITTSVPAVIWAKNTPIISPNFSAKIF
jgi:hypothetical protein